MLRDIDPEPFFFGPAEAQLFGIYHQPRTRDRRAQTGVVICYPIGQEYIRSHAALAALACRLARSGFHVLRFDYGGSGDSQGETCDLATCKRDVARAVEELRRGAALSRVWLLGLRLGANLAAEAVALASNIHGLVLWEPVIRGEPHLAELRGLQSQWVASQCEPAGQSNDSGQEILGFWLSGALQKQIQAIDMLDSERPRVTSIVLLGEANRPSPLLEQLERALTSAGTPVVSTSIRSGGFWYKVEDKQAAIIPNQALDEIVECLSTVS